MIDIFGLTYLVAIIVGAVILVRKVSPRRNTLIDENYDLRKQVRQLRGQLNTAHILAESKSFDEVEKERYEAIFGIVKNTILVYDYGKGRISAAHAIALLKEAIIHYRADCLDIGKEDLEELNHRIDQHVEEMKAKGFNTN